MDLSTVANSELLERLVSLKAEETKTTLSILYHLLELDRRKLFLELGYSSLFQYCVRKLNYSEGGAYRRIAGARILGDYPEIAEMFLAGNVSLCSMATAAEGLRRGRLTCAELSGKSKREVESMVAAIAPVKREVIKPVLVKKVDTPLFRSTLSPVKVADERYEIRFSVTKEVYDQFAEAKVKLSNSLGNHLTVEGVFSKLLQNYLKPRERKTSSGNTSSRYVPRAVKREVYSRDRGECTYVSKDGTKCCEKRYLHFDHIQPFAIGGKTEVSNLRLLCSAHNNLLAEQVFGSSLSR